MSASTGQANPAAFEIGELAARLASGYFAYAAAIHVSRHPDAKSLFPPVRPGRLVPTASVRQTGGEHSFHLRYYLEQAQETDEDEFARVYLAGALLTLGDALSQHRYFDAAPVLELVRHLRNGVAHGNRFNIDQRGRQRLQAHPAHNREIRQSATFEVNPELHGSEVLWAFMVPGDVVTLLRGVETHLKVMGTGWPAA